MQPVFDTILANALRLCEANWAFVVRHQDGWLSLAARTECTREFADYLAKGFPVDRETTAGRAALERKPVQVLDFMTEPGVRVTPAHRSESVRTVLAVPLLREDRLLGVIALRRREVRPFSERQIALLQTFADQAVIAIENVRLFNELEARNRALTEALEQQTATSEILRVISQSPTDVQPVFDTIVAAALKLCAASSSNVVTFDGELIHVAADRDGESGRLGCLAPTLRQLSEATESRYGKHPCDPDEQCRLDSGRSEGRGLRRAARLPLLRDTEASCRFR